VWNVHLSLKAVNPAFYSVVGGFENVPKNCTLEQASQVGFPFDEAEVCAMANRNQVDSGFGTSELVAFVLGLVAWVLPPQELLPFITNCEGSVGPASPTIAISNSGR